MARATFGLKCFSAMAVLIYAFTIVVSQVDASSINAAATEVTVDQSGNGDYRKIQDAIDAVPSKNAVPVNIWVKPGVYKEIISVPEDKPFITISGTNTASDTIITWNRKGEIYVSAVFSVMASDFVARSLTIQNTYGAGAKAVALRVSADRAGFYDCKIMSHQDTLFCDVGRHYFNNCYIEGDTDFIFGSAASVFENCHMHSVSKGYGPITAQRRSSSSEEAGFTFIRGNITGVKTALLGRPWGPYSTVIFIYTNMSQVILPQGWDSWGLSSDKLRNVFYGQYKCVGPGAMTSHRVGWVHELSSEQVLPFLTQAKRLRFGTSQSPAPVSASNGNAPKPDPPTPEGEAPPNPSGGETPPSPDVGVAPPSPEVWVAPPNPDVAPPSPDVAPPSPDVWVAPPSPEVWVAPLSPDISPPSPDATPPIPDVWVTPPSPDVWVASPSPSPAEAEAPPPFPAVEVAPPTPVVVVAPPFPTIVVAPPPPTIVVGPPTPTPGRVEAGTHGGEDPIMIGWGDVQYGAACRVRVCRPGILGLFLRFFPIISWILLS